MQIETLAARMARFPAGLRSMLGGLAEEDARWRPGGGGWSILEVVNHLADEEVEDFRERLSRTLADPSREWPPIDPEGVVASRRYNERDLGDSLARFAVARAESIAWLRGLADPDWKAARRLARGGELTAGDLLAAWAAHDALHLRQIARRLFDLARRDLPGMSAAYAGGDWT